jgi:hypothetical protein
MEPELGEHRRNLDVRADMMRQLSDGQRLDAGEERGLDGADVVGKPGHAART